MDMDSSFSCCNNTSFEDLPGGLVFDILSRLPVRSIIHSTCVCKLWYSIIKTPSFVSSHLTRSISDPSRYYIYLFRRNSTSMAVVSDDNRLLTRHPDFVFPFEIESLKLIGACNGLVCASEDYRDLYFINPSINKYKKLVFESSCYADWIDNFHHSDRLVDIKVGFGYSVVENDYKVVRIFNRYPYRPERVIQGFIGFVLESKAEIYSLKRGLWRSLDLSIELSSHSCPVLVHGCLYWQVNWSSRSTEYLLCFDLKDEVFSKIELPKTYTHLHRFLDRFILIKNGSVAVVAYDELPDGRSSPCMKIYIYVLEKNVGGQVQWKELYYECAALDVVKCIGFSGAGRLLFVGSRWEYKPKYVVAVDLDNSCAIEKLVMDSHICDGVANISESLVLLLD